MALSNVQTPSLSAVVHRPLRDTLGAFATGVVVVTTQREDGQPVGLTVSSFNSVSLDPPLVLWSLSLKAPSLEAFRSHAYVGISILSANQHRLCKNFATPSADKFQDVDYVTSPNGVPLLTGAAAHFECRTQTRHLGGDHEIYIAEVVAYEDHGREPLVFHRGALRNLQQH